MPPTAASRRKRKTLRSQDFQSPWGLLAGQARGKKCDPQGACPYQRRTQSMLPMVLPRVDSSCPQKPAKRPMVGRQTLGLERDRPMAGGLRRRGLGCRVVRCWPMRARLGAGRKFAPGHPRRNEKAVRAAVERHGRMGSTELHCHAGPRFCQPPRTVGNFQLCTTRGLGGWG